MPFLVLRKFLILVLLLPFFQLDAQGPYKPIAKLKMEICSAKNDSARSYLYLVLSNAYIESNYLDSCHKSALMAYEIARKANLPVLMAWAQHLDGNHFFYKGKFDKGVEIQTEVLEKAERLKAPLLAACAKKMIGWIYLEMGKEKEALNLFLESVASFKKYYKEDFQMNVGIAYYGVATSYFYLSDFVKAKLYYDSAIEAKPQMHEREMTLTLADRAAVLRDEMKAPDKALLDAQRAVFLIGPFEFQDDALAYAKSELALTKAMLGRTKEAEQEVNDVLNLYDRVPLIKRYVSVYQTVLRTYLLIGNYKKAYEAGHQIQILKDSIYQWRKIKTIETLQAKYESEKAKNLIEVMRRESLEEKLSYLQSRSAFIISTTVIVLMMIGIFIYYRKREKYQKKIKVLEAAQLVYKEKEKIKQELHDSLGGQLSSISNGLNRLLKENNNEESVQAIQDLADRAVLELRNSLWEMNQESISISELEQRINSLFWQYRKMEVPIDLRLNVDEGLLLIRLHSAKTGHLYRIIQEATHNSIKHSRATQFKIAIEQEKQFIKVTIADNGVGLDLKAGLDGEHYGIRNMKKRAEQMNSELIIESEPENGVKINITIPLEG